MDYINTIGFYAVTVAGVCALVVLALWALSTTWQLLRNWSSNLPVIKCRNMKIVMHGLGYQQYLYGVACGQWHFGFTRWLKEGEIG